MLVNVRIDAETGKTKIALSDGTDISHLIAGVAVRHMAGRMAELTLHIAPSQIDVTVAGDVSHLVFAGLGAVASLTLEDGRVLDGPRAIYTAMFGKAAAGNGALASIPEQEAPV